MHYIKKSENVHIGDENLNKHMNLFNEQIQKTKIEYGTSSLPVSDVLKIPIFKGCKLISGESGISKQCKDLTILETPDGVDWLRGGEFLVSSGYAFKDNKEKYDDIIYKLHQKGVSAFGIKRNRYLKIIPEKMIEQSCKYSLPLILLPFELIYTDAVSQFYEALFYKKNKYLLEQKSILEKFNNIIINGENTQQIVEFIAMLTDSSVLIFDCVYNLISKSVNSSQHELIIEKIIDNISKFYEVNSNKQIQIDNVYINKHEIKNRDKTLGYFIRIGDNPEDKVLRKTINYGCWIISSKMVNNVGDHFNNLKIKKMVTEIIMNKDNLSKSFFLNIREIFQWTDKDKFVGICFHFLYNDSMKNKINDYKKQFYDIILIRILDKNGFLITEKHDNVFVLFPLRDNILQDIKKKVQILYKSWKDEISISYGISDKYTDFIYIKNMYYESMISAIFPTNNLIAKNDSLRFAKIIGLLEDNKELYDSYDSVISKLEDYDSKHNAMLLETLKMYLICNMNKKYTSDKLFIHAETLRYRLNKIKEITGYSLNTSEGIFMLYMGIII